MTFSKSVKCNCGISGSIVLFGFFYKCRECVSTGAAGVQTRRSLGHHLLHPLILRLLILSMCTCCFETQSSPGCTSTRRSKFLTHSLVLIGKPLHDLTIFLKSCKVHSSIFGFGLVFKSMMVRTLF